MNLSEAALLVAELHSSVDDGIVAAYRVETNGPSTPAAAEAVVMFVNEAAAPFGVCPVTFPPRPEKGVPFAVTVADVTPDEFAEIERGDLSLPDGWRIVAEVPLPGLRAAG